MRRRESGRAGKPAFALITKDSTIENELVLSLKIWRIGSDLHVTRRRESNPLSLDFTQPSHHLLENLKNHYNLPFLNAPIKEPGAGLGRFGVNLGHFSAHLRQHVTTRLVVTR